jgi:hypothetical protein
MDARKVAAKLALASVRSALFKVPKVLNMKTKKKRDGSTELPRFIVGALATAGASTASGATVQISFANNVVSLSSGVSNFVTDLSGDSVADVGVVCNLSSVCIRNTTGTGVLGLASSYTGRVKLGSGNWLSGSDRRLVPFTFSDAGIHNSSMTSGFLDLEGWATGTSASLKIHRLIFDDASTSAPSSVAFTDPAYREYVAAVPEPGSNLALLALGAGGLTLRRRLKRAA